MCLVTLNTQDHPQYKLIIAANRDEFYERPTEQATFWQDYPFILGGRDLQQMGTWLGITKSGRIAFLTNFRNPSTEKADKKSRGHIVKEFLTGTDEPVAFLEQLRIHKEEYNGFNFIAGNVDSLYHYGNNELNITPLSAGTHSISNGTLEAKWPKTMKAKKVLQEYVASTEQVAVESLFQQLNDRELAEDTVLPKTGVPLDLERNLSSIFIEIPNYGTRVSTVILVTWNNEVTFVERTFQQGQYKNERRFDFTLINE